MDREYFILRSDCNLEHVIQPINLPEPKALKAGKDCAPFFLARQDVQEYPDYWEKQIYPRNTCRLISDKMKLILEKYSPATFFKRLVFMDTVHRRQEVYWLMEPPMLAAVSSHSQIGKPGLPWGKINKLVLDREQIGHESMFTLSDALTPYLLVSLGIAESMLRRDAWGVQFERVQVQ